MQQKNEQYSCEDWWNHATLLRAAVLDETLLRAAQPIVALSLEKTLYAASPVQKCVLLRGFIFHFFIFPVFPENFRNLSTLSTLGTLGTPLNLLNSLNLLLKKQ